MAGIETIRNSISGSFSHAFRSKRAFFTSPRQWFTTHRSASGGGESVPGIQDVTHDFYNPTFGRWLYNEKKRRTERHLFFDIHALCDIVAESAGQLAGNITRFTKIAEGGSYRIFQASFKNHPDVIVRLPYHCTVPLKYGVASEVATIEYLRLHGIPVPKLLAWSDSRSNRLNCEYIIMKKAHGKELEETWYAMGHGERKSIMEKIVELDSALFQIDFPASGSLYFKDSLPADMQRVNLLDNDDFCVGPSAEHLWFYYKRDELQANRGPWAPRYPREPLYKEFYGRKLVDPRSHILNLENYLNLVPHIIPSRPDLKKPTIRHPDLSPSKIFVNESGEITSAIDRERTAILPLFIQAKIPTHFQNYGDEASESFKLPELPENFEAFSDAESEEAMETYRRRQAHYYYLGSTSRSNTSHFHVMCNPSLAAKNRPNEIASRPWEGDPTSLKTELINAFISWPVLASPDAKELEFPIQYSDAEIKECLEIDAKQKAADEQMQKFRDHLGISVDGWVPSEMYEEVKQKSDTLKANMLEMAESEEERREIDRDWPFQDHEGID